jgi:hypothetical protein
MIDEYVGKDVEGNDRGLFEVISRHACGGTGENIEKSQPI